MRDVYFITYGLAVIAALKLFVLQRWSSTSMSHLVDIDFGVSAVERMCTVLPPFNTTHSMVIVAIPYVSITHWLARRLRLYSSEMESVAADDYYFQGHFRLEPKHLIGIWKWMTP